MAQTSLQTQDVDSISERLKGIPLKLPRSLGEHPDTEAKALYLRNLLRRDPDVFLERYGTDLNSEERALFEPLRPDSFEVDFYMRQLENDKSGIRALTPAVVRNRRLAKLNRLSADDFFSEAAMRKRAPDLADQYMGVSKQSELAPNSMSQGDTLDRLETQVMLQEKQNEAVRQQQAMQEQQQEEEEEEEDDDAGPAAGHSQGQPSEKDMKASHDNQETLVSIMHARFLSGEDWAVDYKDIDKDASLDDDWAAQAENDAQDRYFGDD